MAPRSSTTTRLERLERLQGLLKSGDPVTTGELAADLRVSVRTLSRDIELLRGSGVPIDADRGRGGGVRLESRWSLGRLNLTEEEAIDLLLSMAVAGKMDSPLLLSALRSVRQKLAAAFSDRQQARIRDLRKRIFVGAPASPQVVATYRPPSREALVAVKSAFFEMRRLMITYADEAARITTREIEPQFLYLNVPVWYLLAWDHLRDGVRFFRVDRVRQVEKLAATFRARAPEPFLVDAERTVKTL